MQSSSIIRTEKIPKLLFKLSLPATVAMFVNAIYNIVDSIFIGNGVGSLAIGGLTIVFPIQMIVMAFALTIGTGAGSLLSISLGARDESQYRVIVGNAYFATLVLGVAFFTAGQLFIDDILRLFGATDALLGYAREYLQYILIGTLYFPFVMTSNNLIRSEGNARAAMVSMLIGAVINIFLDYLFVFPLNMGIKGAAIATSISQFTSVIYILLYIKYGNHGKSALRIKFADLRPRIQALLRIISIGLPNFFMQMTGSVLVIILNRSLGYYGGDIAISVYGVIQRITTFFTMPLIGVVQGMQPIAGYNFGAKQPQRVKQVVKLSIIVSAAVALLGMVLIELFPEFFISLFESDNTLVQNGTLALRVIVIFMPIIGIQFVGSRFFQSVGKALPSTLLTLSRQILLLLPLILILPTIGNLGLLGIWLSFPISDLLSTVLTFILLKKEMDRLDNLTADASADEITPIPELIDV